MMKIKLLIFFMAAVIAITSPPRVGAETIHLDGIANAGWSTDDLTKAHLYIADRSNPGTYYYQWKYAPNNPVPWNSREDLAVDLSDGVLFNNTTNEIAVPSRKVESAGDVFNNPAEAIWKKLTLSSGTYTLSLTADSHAYQLNEFLWPGESTDPVWNAYVQMYAVYDDNSEGSFNFGDWTLARGTENDVLKRYRQVVDGMTINIPNPAELYFYINDYNSVDNGGSVTLEFTDPPTSTSTGQPIAVWQRLGDIFCPPPTLRFLNTTFRGAFRGALNIPGPEQLPLLLKSMQRGG